ncbi:porin [Burkholderia plantarii]|uniref:porin n=1 Tax=Burkholderia plantarii TaxID=41899 RepID=UPI0006D89745|nr:porin [Burkholderia plantarii]ALK35087.1 Porin, Gram-negative type [Burkholderia plantarii]GLZ19175.1 porin [Burkholderia plantarii]
MKRSALTIISLASLAITGSAHAQSSVTLYGLIDTSLTYLSHGTGGNNAWLVGNNSAGNLGGSRWGIKGSEDLGAGLKAVFQLENGFDPSNGKLGQGSREFGRQAFVGLAHERLGTVTLGRQYDPLTDLVQPITEDSVFGAAFATAGDVDNYDDSFRVDRSVKYTSPVLDGVRFAVMYSFGGVAGSTGAGQSYSAAVAYSGGPLSLAGGYYHATNSASDLGPRDSWSSSSDGTFDGPINLGYRTAHSLGIARVAGQYAFGKFTVGAGYSNAQYRRDGASLFGENEHYDTAQGFVNYQASPSILMGVGYSYTKSGGDSSATYHQVSLGGIYSLSKRTALYVIAAYQHASGTTSDGAGGKAAAQASIGSYGYAGTNSQTIVNLGIRHTF